MLDPRYWRCIDNTVAPSAIDPRLRLLIIITKYVRIGSGWFVRSWSRTIAFESTRLLAFNRLVSAHRVPEIMRGINRALFRWSCTRRFIYGFYMDSMMILLQIWVNVWYVFTWTSSFLTDNCLSFIYH